MSDSEDTEIFRRARLDDDDDDKDDESEEEEGRLNRMNDDDDEEEEEDITEATDDELLHEIEIERKFREAREQEIERIRQEMIANGTLNENDTFTIDFNDSLRGGGAIGIDGLPTSMGGGGGAEAYQIPGSDMDSDPNAQLTNFQENIITTGSSASIVLLVLLAVMFVVQFIRKVYQHYRLQHIEGSIDSVLGEGNRIKAEDDTMEATSYTVYNTPFDEREVYEQKEREGADLTKLQQILEQRAIRVILRGTKIQEDAPGIKKNWNLDMVPKEVWDDFSAAQVNVQKEFELIIKENKEKQFQWGLKYKENILLYAKEKIQYQKRRQMNERYQKMQQQRQQGVGGGGAGAIGPGGARRPPGGPGGNRPTAPTAKSMINGPNSNSTNMNNNNGPSSRNFGKGFNKGFLNQNKQQEKLTRRQKKKRKQQQAQQGSQQQAGGAQVPGQPSDAAGVYSPGGNDFNPQSGAQTNPQRRKKGRRRMR